MSESPLTPDRRRAALPHPVLRERSDLCPLRVAGDDRASWLNGQVTNDVRAIPAGQCVRALSVDVRGKVQAELIVIDRGDELLVLAPCTVEASLREHFERYIIMEDVTLEPLALRVLMLEGAGSASLADELEPGADVIRFECDLLGVGGVAFVGPAPSLSALRARIGDRAASIGDQDYELARLRCGVPRFGVDFDASHYPQEAGLKAYVSFNKGCYLGQEVVCTLESRGRLSRRLCALHAQSHQPLAAGQALRLPSGEPIGAITSAVWDPELGCSIGLGYVKRAAASVGARLLAGEQPVTVDSIVGEAPDTSSGT